MSRQPHLPLDDTLALRSERLGPLPLLNHFIDRLGLDQCLAQAVPTRDGRVRLPYAKGIGLLLRSILVEREPIYRQQEMVATFAPACYGLTSRLAGAVSDDAVGRALDRLFDADRAALLTDVVVRAVTAFDVVLDELHNDSTTVRFCGQYRGAGSRPIRGKRAPYITYGFSKDHRPDLKQLLLVLTTTRDGGVPLNFRCADGNQSDSRTHEETWDALRIATGRADFLYVADSKLCAHRPMDYIHQNGGRFVTVLPRNRGEDSAFRQWIQTHEPTWERVRDEPHPRRKYAPRDRWWAFRSPHLSLEGWPIVWLYSSLLKIHQEKRRGERLMLAQQELDDLNAKLTGPRPRKRAKHEILKRIDEILAEHRVRHYLRVRLQQDEEHRFRQAHRGRPGPSTRYVRHTRKFWRITYEVDADAIEFDRKSDGMYPLLTNDPSLSNLDIFLAHKQQPTVEKRFEQTKTVFEIAPVLLKNEGRIEALFFVYFLVLLVQALVERELRNAMARENISELPLYPEERTTSRPTAQQILRLFANVQRHHLYSGGQKRHTFDPELTELQLTVLKLLGVPESAYRSAD